MSQTRSGKDNIANAIVWASVMIATSLVIEDRGETQAIIMFMIAGWAATSGLFARKGKSKE